MKITKIDTYIVGMPWKNWLFVEVHTDGGIVGLGEGTCHGRVDVVEAALRWLEPYVIGMDPAGPEKQWERIAYRLTRWSSGIIPRTALSALDIARAALNHPGIVQEQGLAQLEERVAEYRGIVAREQRFLDRMGEIRARNANADDDAQP